MDQSLPEIQDDWDDDDDYDEEEGEEEEEDDADIAAEAQEIARRLGEELWADISKVNAERNVSNVANTGAPTTLESQPSGPAPAPAIAATSYPLHAPRKEEALLATMKNILMLLENDALAKSTLASTTLPNGPNVLDILIRCNTEGCIGKGLSGPLSQVILSLARSESLFGKLKQSNASAIQLDRGKRKRDEFDEGQHLHMHTYKRPYVPDIDLHNQVVEAVRIISHALGTAPSQALDPTLVSSIRLQLHQVFLFAVTSSATAGHNMHALQEISGLIQVIGVLSGIQIGHAPEGMGQPYGQTAAYPWSGGPHSTMSTDIGTAVYPCLVAGCHKTFSRLYSLRAHQRSHSSHRPFRCAFCPASFARNHDLKRHVKLHDKKAWRCEGCLKIFSRRDAIKRHKNGPKNRGPKSDGCLNADVTEVQLEGAEGEDALREERRAKLWNGRIVTHEATGTTTSIIQKSIARDMKTIDEGEINPAVIAGMQASVMSLHGLLQALVGNALGNPVHQQPVPMDPSVGQATLASVIARAQSQNIPSVFVPPTFPQQPPVDQPFPDTANEIVAGATDFGGQPPSTSDSSETQPPIPSLSMYGLSDEQTQLLEIAIANAASAAQAQAEAEAALEEEEEDDYDQDENEYDDSEMEQDTEPALV